MNEQSLFLQALEQPAGEPRRAWLEQACEDLGQRTRIAVLLERHEKAGQFLEKPPTELLGSKEPESLSKAKLITKSKFVDRLIRSKLMTAEEVAQCDSNLESLQAAPDALSYAQAMVKANRLTGFQAKAICDGRIKGLTLGEYIILDRLGKGGMGIVYRARHRRMDRLVAIKVLPRSTMATKGLENRFYREVKTAAKLMHPNIVAALDASEDDGLHYLVMEYVDGQDLGEVLRQSGPFQPEHAVRCIIQAARGLQYAHEQGVIHRDIKPANLLIDSNGTVKVLDMGLARLTGAASDGLDGSTAADAKRQRATHDTSSNGDFSESSCCEVDTESINEQTRLTRAGEVMGTLDYMPPEQFTDSRNVDERGDIYSLGCTLYRLLTGQKPFPAETVSAIFKSHRCDPVPSLLAFRTDIPEHLDMVFQSMLAKEPEQRPRSMLQVIEKLEEALAIMQSSPTAHGRGLQDMSKSRVSPSYTGQFTADTNRAGTPQFVLSHAHPGRQRRRNRLVWMPVVAAACPLLLLGILIFMQESEQSDAGLASSDRLGLSIDASDLLKSEEPRLNRQASRQAGARLRPNDDGDLMGGANRPPEGTGEVPQVTSADDATMNAKAESEEQRASAETAKPLTTGSVPLDSKEESKNPANQAENPLQNDVDSIARRPIDWIGSTIWADGFGFQGDATLGPSPNRQILFNDNGRQISISEDSTGITVSVDGQVIKAANPADLRSKDVQAYQLYVDAFGNPDVTVVPPMSAFDLQRMQLERLRKTHSGTPQLKSLIEELLPENGK